MRKILNFAFLQILFFSVVLFSCANETDSSSAKPTVTAITLTAETLSSATGTAKITATVTGNETATVTWAIKSGSDYATLSPTTSNASAGKATVNITGKNTTTTAQTVTVVASVGDVSSNALSINVPAASSTPPVTQVTSVTISGDDSVNKGSSVTLTATPNKTPLSSVYTWTITEGSSFVTFSPSTTSTLVLTGKAAGTVKVKASVDGVSSAEFTLTVKDVTPTPQEVIKASDTPTGYASVGWNTTAGSGGKVVTVTTRADLVNYAWQGGYLIYVNGIIDMTEGMLPNVGGGSNATLDAFVKTTTTSLNSGDSTKYPVVYQNYADYKAAYVSSCSLTTDDSKRATPQSTVGHTMWGLNTAYGNTIKLNIASNTTIIGLGSNSGIKGGTISIAGVSNVAIRNLDISDAYDPFPHHEKNDGYNAQWDGITIQGSTSNIWIDHCTFRDTLELSHVMTGGTSDEKYQTYDGTCDIKGSGENITVSYCKFYNHDKTMLIGSSDSEGSNSIRKITLHHNYFLNCGQRLPMVRNTTIHIYNNYYDMDSAKYYASQYAVGVRKNSIIYAENNYFGSGIKISFRDSYGQLYSSGNIDNASSGHTSTVTGSNLFSSAINAYSYTAQTAQQAKDYVEVKSGSGKCTVEQ
ncbi:pectate lyase family protein [Treponema pectinovorum]|uniref:pectate lyase family protein n=1 Tax=Treponema pectinovorum TaxID=164 RepID=UPI0011C9AFD2|nr:polysaccharide lyase family 1 protein [Treponema pectinovorum]